MATEAAAMNDTGEQKCWTAFFETKIIIPPIIHCTKSEKIEIGFLIDETFDDAFKNVRQVTTTTDICPDPMTKKVEDDGDDDDGDDSDDGDDGYDDDGDGYRRWRFLQRRKSIFYYVGGGQCRLCRKDNTDNRRHRTLRRRRRWRRPYQNSNTVISSQASASASGPDASFANANNHVNADGKGEPNYTGRLSGEGEYTVSHSSVLDGQHNFVFESSESWERAKPQLERLLARHLGQVILQYYRKNSSTHCLHNMPHNSVRVVLVQKENLVDVIPFCKY